MKKILIFAALALTMGFISCSKTAPEDKARDIINKVTEAMKSQDFAKVQAVQEEEIEYLKDCTDEERAAYNVALQKYGQEILNELMEKATEAEENPEAEDLSEPTETDSIE